VIWVDEFIIGCDSMGPKSFEMHAVYGTMKLLPLHDILYHAICICAVVLML